MAERRHHTTLVLGGAILLLGTLALLGACDDDERVCEPGVQIECACVGGAQGAQTCADDGSRWLECRCPEPDGDGDADSDGDSDSDTDADTDSDGDADSDTDADIDGDAGGDADGDADGDGDADIDGDADGDGDADLPGECPGGRTCAEIAREVFDLVNEQRGDPAIGCDPLTWDDTLAAVAQECADLMQVEESVRSCRGTLGERLERYDVGFSSAGQNNAHHSDLEAAVSDVASGTYLPDCEFELIGVAVTPAAADFLWISIVFVVPHEL